MITTKLSRAKQEYEDIKKKYNNLIHDISKHFNYWIKDKKPSEIYDSTKADIIAHIFQGRSGYNSISAMRSQIYDKDKKRHVKTDLLVFNLSIKDHYGDYTTHKIVHESGITLSLFNFPIKNRWIERLQNVFDRKIETSLDEYKNYVSTLKGFDLLDEFKIRYEVVNIPKFGIKNWVFIESLK